MSKKQVAFCGSDQERDTQIDSDSEVRNDGTFLFGQFAQVINGKVTVPETRWIEIYVSEDGLAWSIEKFNLTEFATVKKRQCCKT